MFSSISLIVIDNYKFLHTYCELVKLDGKPMIIIKIKTNDQIRLGHSHIPPIIMNKRLRATIIPFYTYNNKNNKANFEVFH